MNDAFKSFVCRRSECKEDTALVSLPRYSSVALRRVGGLHVNEA